jgi:hypothetical protein
MPFDYASRPVLAVYKALQDAVRNVRSEVASMRPHDMIDMQSFLWVHGLDEYPD